MREKAKDRQPMKPDGTADRNSQGGLGEREGWSVDELAEEASQQEVNEIQRMILRGDETEGDPDKRDIAGATDFEDTDRGREETKNDLEEKANVNG